MYSLIARSVVRGVDPAWVRSLMGFALVPDRILYLRCGEKHLIPRVLDVYKRQSLWRSFCRVAMELFWIA